MSGEYKTQILEYALGTLKASHRGLTIFSSHIFFISEHLLIINNTNKCSILTGLHSDHSIVTLELNKSKLKRGRGFWKFNNKLLYDREYVNLIFF